MSEPPACESRPTSIRVWVILVLNAIHAAGLGFGIITYVGLGRYNAAVSNYKEFHSQDPTYSRTHVMRLNFQGKVESDEKEMLCKDVTP
jgi:hypothetical protein